MPVKEQSPETQDVIARLSQCAEGDVVTYDELSDIAGRNLRTEGRWILESARRIVEREFKLHFEPVRGVGMRRISNGEQVPLAEAGHRAIGRKTGRITRMLETTRAADLPAHRKAAYHAVSAWNSTLRYFSSPRTFTRLNRSLATVRVRSEKDVQDALAQTVEGFITGRLRQPKKA